MRKLKIPKGVKICVHPDFYRRIERDRQKFMKQNRLNKLSTVAFTGVMVKDITKKNALKYTKKQKR